MRLDAHQHFWRLGHFDDRWLHRPEHARLCRDYLPADLKPLLDAAGLERSIFVQTQHDLGENDWALALADEHDWLAGVVGWVDLHSDECAAQLLHYRQHPKFVGVRHITQDESDDDFIIRPAVLRGLQVLEKHGVPFDLLFYAKHLRHAPTVARHCPSLTFVLDHLAKPNVRARQFADWHADLRAAAACPNVMCKLSGLVTEADRERWTHADLRPYLNAAIEAFRPKRCLFGSDWPVCLLAAEYADVAEVIDGVVGALSAAEQERIWGGTATAVYGLCRPN